MKVYSKQISKQIILDGFLFRKVISTKGVKT